jgi:ABC-type multidrug transport system permease subunit
MNLKKLIGSFDNEKGGWSARKLSAFDAVVMANVTTIFGLWMTYLLKDAELIKFLASVWLLFAATCLGIVTVEQLIKLKNGTTKNENDV